MSLFVGFLFLFDVFVSGAGAIKTPAVRGGTGVFIALCVSWRRPRSRTRTPSCIATSRGFGILFFSLAAGCFLSFGSWLSGSVSVLGFGVSGSVRFPGVSLSVFLSRISGFWRFFVACALASCIFLF